MKKIVFAFIGATLLFGCGEAGQEKELVKEVCSYELDSKSSTVTWTAFKTSEKKGVSGTFDSFSISTDTASNPINILLGASFSADILTPNTNNPARDTTLMENFFGLLQGDDISGKIISAADGRGVIEVNINNKAMKYDFGFSFTDLVYKINFQINLDSLGADSALAGIHEACGQLHIGEDGVSALWPTVNVEIISTVIETCK
ncbi:MAG: YceI family protein [Flavobacteriales bacterium]|nr:YceI family protein [Flavobacteriales bacterium]